MSQPSTPTKQKIWIFCRVRDCYVLERAVRTESNELDPNGMDSDEEVESSRLETKAEVMERLGGESRAPPPAPMKKKAASRLSLREREEQKRRSAEKKKEEEEPQGALVYEMGGLLSPLTDEHYDAQDPRSAMEQLFTDVEPIGKGNFGEVYRGKYKGDKGKWYAIKKSLTTDSGKAVKEVKGFQQIPPNKYITEYVSGWLDRGLVYIQTELCEMSLLAYCRNGLEEDEIWKVLVQVVLGLRHLHTSGFCHNDLKPDNILVKDTVIKIADFGLVSRVNEEWCAGDEGDSRYLAPEVFSQKVFTTAGDVFAAGMSLLEITTGLHMPPQGDVRNILIGGRTPSRFFHGRSIDLREIIESMIRRNPEARPSAWELLEHPIVKSYKDSKDEVSGEHPWTPATSTLSENYRLRRKKSRMPPPPSADETPKRRVKVRQEEDKENEDRLFMARVRAKNGLFAEEEHCESEEDKYFIADIV
ncbi:hypothetical protein GCK72_000312 [Caenorhabditis remanei]|uniref:non-specific serine/threonine protein kinase n=1 Tax=Caenorhabditis remanei TaxID=31234 RepID=A0A6A5HJZ3_CAERE|nr:hypothetical protein GCK72_000312 [Caenorhabditis remanei]KAF1768500.1 hypothetical protein GCK72_000312 [Caenorhabditis remanei]